MTSTIRPVRLTSDLGPKAYFAERNVPFDLPISGGWGYGMGDPVTIEKSGLTEDGIRAIQTVFGDLRLQEEMALLRAAGHEITAVGVEMISSGQTSMGDDKLLQNFLFRVTLSLGDSQQLPDVRKPLAVSANDGESSNLDKFGINGQVEVTYKAKFWFDISCCTD